MSGEPRRFNVTLDARHAEKLAHLAERTYLQEGALARALLSQAIDAADPDPLDVVAILDGIPGALESMRRAREEIARGEGIPLSDLG